MATHHALTTVFFEDENYLGHFLHFENPWHKLLQIEMFDVSVDSNGGEGEWPDAH